MPMSQLRDTWFVSMIYCNCDDNKLNEVCNCDDWWEYSIFLNKRGDVNSSSIDSLWLFHSGITLTMWNVFVVPNSESSSAPGGGGGHLSDFCLSGFCFLGFICLRGGILELTWLIDDSINCCNTILLSRIFGIWIWIGFELALGFLDLLVLVTPEFPGSCE